MMIVCSFIIIAILGGVSIAKSSQIVQEGAKQKLEWMARQYAARFSNELNLIEENVKEMGAHFRDTFDIERLREDSKYLEEYEKELDEYLFNFATKRASGIAAWCYFNPELSETPHDVYYVDENDDKIPDRQDYIPFSYYDGIPTPTDDKQWWYGPIETKKGFWTNPYEWTLKNGEIIKVVSYAQPIFIDNQLIAVIGTYYHFDEMFEDITDIKVYKSGYVTLYNEKLDIIIHPNYKSGTRDTSDNLQEVENGRYAEISAEIMSNNHGMVSYDNLEGKTQLMAYSKLSNGWVLGINPVEGEMLAGVYELTYQLVGAVMICMILSVVAAYIMGIHITKPLRKVVQGARQIGAGDLDVCIEVNTNDEIKTVANSLNNMVSDTKRLQEELSQLAYYDNLTGIPNKNLFKYTVQKLVAKSEAQYAYVVLDINKFTLINDVFGYAYGDSLLKYISKILLEEFEEEEVVTRDSGDEFHIFCHFTSRHTLEARLEKLDTRISHFISESNPDYRISMCFGIYVVQNINLLIESMGDKAGLAVKKIKGAYSTSFYYYNDDIGNRILEEQEIENDMQNGLDNEDFIVYIQPKYSLETLQIEGAEALVRWNHPQKGFMPPDAFISVFEKNGFITKLDMFVLNDVCKKLRAWMDKGKVPVVISVNQSRLHLNNPNYLNNLAKILERHKISPEWIELEVTESAFFEDTEKMIETLNKLHDFGFKISMDDFGSGYSSLNMLNKIPVDILKIDKNFFNESSNNERGKKIVGNIISMARDLDMIVVAEGVETKEQVEFLKQTDCGLVQGYYFARPMPIEAFEEKLLSKRGENKDA